MRSGRFSKTALLSLLLYLGAVGFGVADMALYGPDAHEHGGQPCPVHHFVSQSDSADAPGVALAVAPAWRAGERLRPGVQPAVTGFDYPAYNSRAPPRAFFS